MSTKYIPNSPSLAPDGLPLAVGRVLVPFDRREAMPLKDAAAIAGMSMRTVRRWCSEYGIGRRIADGNWSISRPMLHALLEGDQQALIAYGDGVRAQEPVARHFRAVGLGALLELPEFGAARAKVVVAG